MLQAQVNYWTLQEQKRHNLESERLGFDTLAETMRHNVTTEGLSRDTLSENIRHNTVSEAISWSNLGETRRHNKTQEAIGWRSLGIDDFNATTNRINADTRQKEYQLSADQFEWSKFEYGGDIIDRNIRQQEADTHASQAETAEYNAQTQRKAIWYNTIADVAKAVFYAATGAKNKKKGGK